MSDSPTPKPEEQAGQEATDTNQAALDPEALRLAREASDKGVSVKELIRREAQSEAQKLARAEVRKGLEGFRKVKEQSESFNAMLESLQEAGAFKDGVDLDSLRQQYTNEALMNLEPPEEDTPDSETPAEETPEPSSQEQLVIAEGERLAEQYGLEDGDPELDMIVEGQGIKAWLDSIEQAGKAKQERVKKSRGMPMETGESGTAGEPNPLKDNNDPDALLEQALYPNG